MVKNITVESDSNREKEVRRAEMKVTANLGDAIDPPLKKTGTRAIGITITNQPETAPDNPPKAPFLKPRKSGIAKNRLSLLEVSRLASKKNNLAHM